MSSPYAERPASLVSTSVVPLPHIGSTTVPSDGTRAMLIRARASWGKNLPRYSCMPCVAYRRHLRRGALTAQVPPLETNGTEERSCVAFKDVASPRTCKVRSSSAGPTDSQYVSSFRSALADPFASTEKTEAVPSDPSMGRSAPEHRARNSRSASLRSNG